jgi:hypothetical protein
VSLSFEQFSYKLTYEGTSVPFACNFILIFSSVPSSCTATCGTPSRLYLCLVYGVVTKWPSRLNLWTSRKAAEERNLPPNKQAEGSSPPVSILTGLQAGQPGIESWHGQRTLLFCLRDQTASEASSLPSPLSIQGREGSLPGSKGSTAWSWSLAYIYRRGRERVELLLDTVISIHSGFLIGSKRTLPLNRSR